MSVPKDPLKVRDVCIPPLKSTKVGGEPYKRRTDVEASIGQALRQPPAEWVAIAKAKGERRLPDEALVYLVRAARHESQDVFGGLVDELCRRLVRASERFAQGFDACATEAIVTKVEIAVIELVLAKTSSRQSEFLEIAFKQAVERRTINAVEKYRHDAMFLATEMTGASGDDTEPDDPIENLKDDEDGPAEILLSLEVKALVRIARHAVKNRRHLEAVVLHCLQGWPLSSSDPNKPCLERHFGISARQIHNWITKALECMRSAIGAKL
jgi:hypothetical protein